MTQPITRDGSTADRLLLLSVDAVGPAGHGRTSRTGVVGRGVVPRARAVETAERYSPRFCERNWSGALSTFVEDQVPPALARGASVREACDRWGSGAYLLKTIPSVLFILARHAGDPEEAIVRAVTDTSDNDTIAALVGAAVGALHGRQAIPERWIAGLSGRTRDADHGHVFELIEAASARFANPGAEADEGVDG